MNNKFFGSLIAIAFVIAACSSSTRGAAAECSADGDCNSGLSCLPLATFSADGGCTEGAQKACSKACVGDSDCASLGANFKCFASCGTAPMTCGATE